MQHRTTSAALQRLYARLQHGSPWVSLVLLVVCYGLYQFGQFITDIAVVVWVGIAIVFGLIDRLMALHARLDQLTTLTQSLTSTSADSLQSLDACQNDLRQRLTMLPATQPVIIEHLGLNMWHAWDYVVTLLDTIPARHIEIRLLMMTDQVAVVNPVAPKEVQDWAAIVPRAIEKMETRLTTLTPYLQAQYRQVQVTVRTYPTTPVLHGFRVCTPIDVCYLSFCSWEAPTYTVYNWGQFAYRTLTGDQFTDSQQHLRALFIGTFQHLWQTSPVVFDYQTATTPSFPAQR